MDQLIFNRAANGTVSHEHVLSGVAPHEGLTENNIDNEENVKDHRVILNGKLFCILHEKKLTSKSSKECCDTENLQ